MRCAKVFNDLRSLSLHHPTFPSVVMLWCLREAQSYPSVFRAFSHVPRAQEIGAARRQESLRVGLSNAALQRLSGRCSRRLRAYAAKHGIPVVYSTTKGDRKHLTADDYRPQDPKFTGLFLVIIGRAPGLLWNVQHNQGGPISPRDRRLFLRYLQLLARRL
jgi:hypothetical protein